MVVPSPIKSLLEGPRGQNQHRPFDGIHLSQSGRPDAPSPDAAARRQPRSAASPGRARGRSRSPRSFIGRMTRSTIRSAFSNGRNAEDGPSQHRLDARPDPSSRRAAAARLQPRPGAELFPFSYAVGRHSRPRQSRRTAIAGSGPHRRRLGAPLRRRPCATPARSKFWKR